MRTTLLFVFFIGFLGNSAHSQTQVYVWEEGFTYFKGQFDPNKYSAADLDHILDYLVNNHPSMLTASDVWDISQTDSVSTHDLDSVYHFNKSMLETMKVPEGAFWKELHAARVQELEEIYEAKKAMLVSFNDPSTLLTERFTPCEPIAKALNGTDAELLTAWDQLNEEQKKNNCCPEEVDKRYFAELTSEYSLKYARLHLTTYAWWNCINATIPHVVDEKGEHMKAFIKLFESTEAAFLED